MNTKLMEMKKEITQLKESNCEGNFAMGLYIQKIGYKYVHILNVFEKSTIDKVKIVDFYNTFKI